MDSGFDDKLRRIESSWKPALAKVFQTYIDLDREPSDEELEAFGSILGSSHNEVRRAIGRQAKAQGKSLLQNYVP
ncbi:hypothetical protein [Aurantimonas sp. 22II-16-19i]|uniref:hypothetical protein n=1 Tax=Aurantimonas sp. 22II-16-19i TaxID=1317114 RepID=UPI0009F8027D|nr:hypothetical protein [Aurantimonas sp. 22II-16-19i]ORE94923.1 hypothetical protein ATO4_13615 [Aurantimonas sp. 22II-16-19i]